MEEKAKPDSGDITTGGSLMHSSATIDISKADFSGYVTKANMKCEDGRTIMPDAFKDQDGQVVPLVWQHNHGEPENVLGHVLLKNVNDGVYGYGFFNETEQATTAKALVHHKDINSLSIYANKLMEKTKQVLHGVIREVSLVLSGANPGALIDNVVLAHGNGDMVTIEDEAIIYTGEQLGEKKESGDEEKSEVTHSADDPTVQEVYDAMDEDQKNVVAYMVGAALEDAAAQHGTEPVQHGSGGSGENNDEKEGTVSMRRNVFEQQNGNQGGEEEKHVLTHDAMRGIIENAQKMGSMKAAFEGYALEHGIENLDLLFPDAKAVTQTPEFDSRRTEWVSGVINGTKHLPFSRLKTRSADLTHEDARAKGYIKGNLKKEEFFRLMQRVTTPKTIYKKQKLDRDDIIDITDMDVVAWMKGEMRLMLDEEIARAVLLGDGRAVDDEDKISDPEGAPAGEGIRSIVHDDDLYAATITLPFNTSGTGQAAVVDELLRSMRFYKGSGSPTFYTTLPNLTWLLLARDGMGRRMYRTASDLAAELGVGSIVTVEVMEDYANIVGIIVNLNDYSLGADRGGDVAFFDDFDIDYNQYKYLIETRLSGALTKIRSAIVIQSSDAGDTAAVPAAPTFDGTDVTIVDTAGIVYRNAADNTVMTAAGSPYAVAPGDAITVTAEPDATHYVENNVDDEWTFENNA